MLSLLLALVIVVGLLPTAALADDRDEFAITISMEGATLGQGFYVEPRRYTLDQINKLVGIENLGPYTSETVTAAVATYAMLLDQKIEYTMTGTWEKIHICPAYIKRNRKIERFPFQRSFCQKAK